MSGIAYAIAGIGIALCQLQGGDIESRDGVWGNLEIHKIILEPPEELLWPELFTEQTLWTFPELTMEALEKSLRRLRFSESWIASLKSRSDWSESASGIVAKPSEKVILELTPLQRSALYDHLWHHGFGARAFLIERGDLQALGERQFPERWSRFVSERTIDRHGRRYFCDAPVVLGKLANSGEKRALVSALARTRALTGRLKLNKDSNAEALLQYWASGRNARHAGPILKAALAQPLVDGIDIIHLLPPTPRKNLNSYSKLEDQVHSDLPDCHWTALTFFEAFPFKRMLDVPALHNYLHEKYTIVKGSRQFGDTIVLSDIASGEAVHSYTHIADDIVYTKNGISVIAPWALMHEDNMLSRYDQQRMTLRVYRMK